MLRKRLRLTLGTSELPVQRVPGRAGKEAKREADHSPMFSQVVKKMRRYTSTSRHAFLRAQKQSLVNQYPKFELSSACPQTPSHYITRQNAKMQFTYQITGMSSKMYSGAISHSLIMALKNIQITKRRSS